MKALKRPFSLGLLILVTWLATGVQKLVAQEASPKPPSSQKLKTVIFDADETLWTRHNPQFNPALSTNPKENAKFGIYQADYVDPDTQEHVKETYVLQPHVVEVIQRLQQEKIQIYLFTWSPLIRNTQVLSQIPADKGQSLLDLIGEDHILNRRHLTELKEGDKDSEHSFFRIPRKGNGPFMKKRLDPALFDLETTVLIDDYRSFTYQGQEANLLWLGPFQSETTKGTVRIPQDYQNNRLVYAMGLLQVANQYASTHQVSFREALWATQWKSGKSLPDVSDRPHIKFPIQPPVADRRHYSLGTDFIASIPGGTCGF